MFSKGFIYLVLVAFYCKSKANSPGSKDSKSIVSGKKIAIHNEIRIAINSMKAQRGNFSSYGPLIKKLQNQVNRLKAVFNSFGESFLYSKEEIKAFFLFKQVILLKLSGFANIKRILLELLSTPNVKVVIFILWTILI